MAYIRKVPYEESDGVLRREYDAARRRAGRVWEILAVQSQNPAVLRDSTRLYRSSLYGESPLTRVQREMLAVVVSTVNGCHY